VKDILIVHQIVTQAVRHAKHDLNYLNCFFVLVMVTDDSQPASLVINTEESLTASFLPLVLVKVLVEIAPVRLCGTVQVVPPVAHKILLGEDGAIRTQEAGGLSTGRTHMENLDSKNVEKVSEITSSPDTRPLCLSISPGTPAGSRGSQCLAQSCTRGSLSLPLLGWGSSPADLLLLKLSDNKRMSLPWLPSMFSRLKRTPRGVNWGRPSGKPSSGLAKTC
jgi:hypothetical protein